MIRAIDSTEQATHIFQALNSAFINKFKTLNLSKKKKWWADRTCAESMIQFITNQYSLKSLDLRGSLLDTYTTARLFDELSQSNVSNKL